MYDRGSYVLLIYLGEETAISIGRLGRISFSPGYYVYAGSALNGLEARVNRHLSGNKRRHWHIDYLLEAARVIEVWCARHPERLECHLARGALNMDGASLPARGFGSSDCRCPAHLVHLPGKVSMETLQSALGEGIELEIFELPL